MKIPLGACTATIIFFSLMPIVRAAGCGRFSPCGEVDNHSGYTLRYTTILDDDCKKGPNRCDVWNHDGGNKNFDPPVCASCHQISLGPGKHVGGGSVDVDAFTYADRAYLVTMGSSRTRQIKKGVWTKVESTEKAVCSNGSGTQLPSCRVYFDVGVSDVGLETNEHESLVRQDV